MPYVSTVLDSLLQRLLSIIYKEKSEQYWTKLFSWLYFHFCIFIHIQFPKITAYVGPGIQVPCIFRISSQQGSISSPQWLHICSFCCWQFLYFKSFCDKSPPVTFLFPLEFLCLQSRWCVLFGGDGMRFHHSFWWIWEFFICISFCTSFRVLCIFFSRFLLSGQHISLGSLCMGLSILCFSCVVFRCFFLFSIVCLLMFESFWR